MVKIRLTRQGAKKRPFYRIIAIDERKARDGRPLEYLGTFDPKTNPETVNLRSEAIEQYEAAVRVDPDFAVAKNNLAYLLAEEGRELLVQVWKHKLRVIPTIANTDAWHNDRRRLHTVPRPF